MSNGCADCRDKRENYVHSLGKIPSPLRVMESGNEQLLAALRYRLCLLVDEIHDVLERLRLIGYKSTNSI